MHSGTFHFHFNFSEFAIPFFVGRIVGNLVGDTGIVDRLAYGRGDRVRVVERKPASAFREGYHRIERVLRR